MDDVVGYDGCEFRCRAKLVDIKTTCCQRVQVGWVRTINTRVRAAVVHFEIFSVAAETL
jgi:hypothetical protein